MLWAWNVDIFVRLDLRGWAPRATHYHFNHWPYVYTAWQWRSSVSYLCMPFFAVILKLLNSSPVKLFEKCLLLRCCINTLRRYGNDLVNIFENQNDSDLRLNNTTNLRPLIPHIMPMPCFTHKMAIVLWPSILWRHFIWCIVAIRLDWLQYSIQIRYNNNR